MNNAKFKALKSTVAGMTEAVNANSQILQATTERRYKIDAMWCAKEEAYREWRINDPAVQAKQAREQPDSAWADKLFSRAATLCPRRAELLRREYEEAVVAFWNFVQGEKE